jgi:protein-tyrosine phosphatase
MEKQIHKIQRQGSRLFSKQLDFPCVLFLVTSAFHPIFAGMKILMVCLGNICRSPLAEGILQDRAFKAGLSWSVESAGTESYHIGSPPHHLSQKVARMNGIEICNQKARRFVAEDFERFDKIFALSNDVLDEIKRIAGKKFDASRVDLLMNELYPNENLDVPDPWYGTEEGYHRAFELIDAACDAIVKKYAMRNAQHSMSNPSKPSNQ